MSLMNHGSVCQGIPGRQRLTYSDISTRAVIDMDPPLIQLPSFDSIICITEVTFILLKSSSRRSYNIGDACSPKSMYRLADKASHEDLKKHAFDNLCSQFRPKNVITEIFSKFTPDYPEISGMEMKSLARPLH
ncbi:hypothetical protein ARMSODRAFT_351783 [Armillaria solidipes]|uniref:Uncharacterized protein n=1 Tax=Armillaria solidipes TaxID=1076256 RepID=A0A2H3BHU0_9AGAR|nr:hypothetical protein ARMSODRAFT_351783 [Armillaria solidipes]